MDEKQLLSQKTFIELLNMNELERIGKENELYLIAKGMGLEKRFKDTLKKYEGVLKHKISMAEDELPKCKYDIGDYNWGNYSCTVNGITDKTNYKFSNIPVIPVERYINQDTHKEKVKIIFYSEGNWKELIVDKSQLSISQKLLILSDYGLDVNSNNVKYYINYFSDIMSINNIKKLESVSHIGWKSDLFIPYDSQGIFDGVSDAKNIYEAISTKGNYQKWKETIIKLRDHKVIKMLMAVTLASPLIEKLGIHPYMVNLWSSMSGNGKTLTCMVAMSIWGNPSEGALRLSSNNTHNFYMKIASITRNITCYFDELQIIKKNKNFDLEGLVMDLCNGTDKGRLTKDSDAKEVRIWHNNFLFTSNDSLVKENAGEQVYNRVIDIEICEKIMDDPQMVARIIRENYGFMGKEYIAYIQKKGFDTIFDRYQEIYKDLLEKTKATDKQAGSLASILLADELICECVFNGENPLIIDDIQEYVNDKDDIRTFIKAKEYITNIIAINIKKFEEYGYGEKWGRFKDVGTQYEVCYINYEILCRELEKGGFEFNTIKKEWVAINFLIKNSVGRFTHQTTMDGQKGIYVILNLNYTE